MPMTEVVAVNCVALELSGLAQLEGRLVVIADPEGGLDAAGKRIDRLGRGALKRALASPAWDKLGPGEALSLAFLPGLAAEAVQIVKLPRRAETVQSRKAGATVAAAAAGRPLHLALGTRKDAAALALGLMLRAYAFTDHKTGDKDAAPTVTIHVADPEGFAPLLAEARALAEGVLWTRDLVNEPANVLTTTEFADRLTGLKKLGVKVEVLEEAELEKLGMRTLLAVGQGSETPSKVVVMQWLGGPKKAKPFALIGKGVVFDTGGISMKPASGMEDMTMDMGGAGTVAGVMKTLALRKAKANVVGIVGLVENMPDGRAQRPGDVVRSMMGDTVEVINTDAEGRLVLADVLWYAQERFEPTGMIDLATLTGAIIIGLGHEMAGVFSNNDKLVGDFLKAAGTEGDGAWRMPLAPAFDKALKSNIADMMNVGGRPGGSITAAMFLQRFVKPGMPWIHLDIAGVASVKSGTDLAPKGATGWGVLALNRLIADRYEG
jgi:leucyl aminopeptidase